MSEQFETLAQPVDPTNGPKAPKVASAASEQKAFAVEGTEPTTARPSFNYEAAAQRAPGEF